MNTTKKLLSLFFILPLLLMGQIATANNPEVKVIEMEGTNQMKFTVANIQARPGQTIRVKLTTVSDFPKTAMAHNFVLLKSGVDATAVARAAARASDNAYIPKSHKDKIIAHTDLAGGGETVEVTFTVPEKPGEYEYICSFPGHFSGGMKGTLTVTKKAT